MNLIENLILRKLVDLKLFGHVEDMVVAAKVASLSLPVPEKEDNKRSF